MTKNLGWSLTLFALACSTLAEDVNWPSDADLVCLEMRSGRPRALLRESGVQGTAVVLRVLDECDLNRQVLFLEKDGVLEISGSTSVGLSVHEQLMQLRRQQPKISFDSACRAVTMSEAKAPASSIKSLSRLATALEKVRVSPTIGGPLVIHGTQYSLWTKAFVNRAHFEFQGVQGSGQEGTLQAWSDQALGLLDFQCSGE